MLEEYYGKRMVYPGDFYFFYTQVQDFLALFERNTV